MLGDASWPGRTATLAATSSDVRSCSLRSCHAATWLAAACIADFGKLLISHAREDVLTPHGGAKAALAGRGEHLKSGSI